MFIATYMLIEKVELKREILGYNFGAWWHSFYEFGSNIFTNQISYLRSFSRNNSILF